MLTEADALAAVADLLACPVCHGAVQITPSTVTCAHCNVEYRVSEGILDFLGDTAATQRNAFYDDFRYVRMQQAMAVIHREHYQNGSLSGWGERSIKSDVADLLQPNHALVVDLGCGTGSGFHLFPGQTTIIGVDANLDLLHLARERNPQAVLIRADLQRLPFKNASVPALLALSVLEHTFFLEAVLAEIRRVQNQKAYVYVVFPNEGGLGCTLVRRLITGPRNARLSGLTTAEFMRAMEIEHCNTAAAIESQIKKHFVIERRRGWPLRIGGRAFSLALSYRLRPLN